MTQGSAASTAHRGTRLIWRIISRRPGITLLAFTTAVAATLLQVAVPALTGTAIDIATGNRTGSIATVAWAMIAIAVGQYLAQIVRRWSAGSLSVGSQHTLRVDVLDTLMALDGPGQDRIVTGQIVSRSISDLNQFQSVLAIGPLAFSRAVQLVATVVVMLTVSVPLTLMSLAFLPVILFLANRSRTTLYAATWANQQATADLAEHVEQTVSGVRVVKAFGREDQAVDTLDALGRSLYAIKMRTATLTARFKPLLSEIPNFALVITIVAGGLLALRGSITVGDFVALTAYLTSMTTLMKTLANTYVTLQMGMSSVDRLDDVLRLRPDRPTPTEPLSLADEPLGLTFTDVNFSTDGHQVLHGLSLRVEPGESVAIVGGPGAGKSMAVQLAGGFYQPDSGQIALTGSRVYPYDQLTLQQIRENVTAVFDEAFLFSSSISDNISMGHPVTAAEVRRAAELAHAHEFIERLPDGYDTIVGERGLTLSGGQRQRIALARALLSRPQVMLLDDATSAIDTENEQTILRNLREELATTTVIAIAHRQSTVDNAERVIVMERGRVIADGPREEIMATKAYQALMAPESDDWDVAVASTAEPSREELWPAGMDNALGTAERHATVHAAPTGSHGRMITETPGLKERVAALPPATEEPKLDTAPLRARDRDFRVRDLFKAVRWLIVGVVILLILGVLADLAFPTLIRAAIDRGIVAGNAHALWVVAGLATFVVLGSWLTAIAMTVLSSRSGERLLYGLRLRSYAHLQRLGLSYFESHLSGRIMTRMTTDIDTLSSFLQTGLAQAIVSLGTLVGVSAMLVATDGSLTLLAFAAVPVIVVTTLIFRTLSKRFYSEARQQVSTVNGLFAELIGGIRTGQMHRTEAVSHNAFEAQSRRYLDLRMRSQILVAIYFPGMQAISQIMTAIVIGVGASRVMDGSLSVGVLVAFTMYLGQLYGPIQQLGQIFDSWQQATISFDRISQLLATRTTVPDSGQTQGARDAATGAIMFDGVDFSYLGTDTHVVNDLTVTFRPGETVALVGSTGAGKSTVVKLLARFYDPTAGTITASGVPITEFPVAEWRRAIAQVPQESYFFPGTVADNIAYGTDDATPEQVEGAVRRIGALSVVATIPGGFSHTVGERGRGLSAGQRQIIALARAEMLRAPIMLLDEATATLDPATEKAVLDASAKATQDRTSIIVAHRLATARRADRILVIERGRIIEDGSHDLLLARGGKYARMWDANH